MEKHIKRPRYLQKLMSRRNNGEIKIITGPRRSGKSYLLSENVPSKNIISISFDMDEDIEGNDLTNPLALKKHLYAQIQGDEENYYVFLDEIQMVEGFERIVNGLNARDNVDVYITGSNSKFLSSDINTIFRGRGDEIRVYPLSFNEFIADRAEPLNELWKEYYTYGGMPALRNHKTPEQKITYLQRLWQKTYIDDVVERNNVKNRHVLECLVDSLCSSIGSLTNPTKIRNTLLSLQHVKIEDETLANYLQYLENAFLFEGAKRYNVKGRKYYESIKKYYAADVGLRNARLNFRQIEPTHLMENAIYNYLKCKGFRVNVGVIIRNRTDKTGKHIRVPYEIDFVVKKGMYQYYIQSAFSMESDEKTERELYPFSITGDSFRKIVVTRHELMPHYDSKGIFHVGVVDFLLGDYLKD